MTCFINGSDESCSIVGRFDEDEDEDDSDKCVAMRVVVVLVVMVAFGPKPTTTCSAGALGVKDWTTCCNTAVLRIILV